MITFICRHGSNSVCARAQNAKRIRKLKIQPIRFLFCLFCACQFCFVEFHAIAANSCTNSNSNKVYMMFVCPLRFCVATECMTKRALLGTKQIPPVRFAIVWLTVCILRAKIQKVIDILNTLNIRAGWAHTAQHRKIQHCRPTITENIIITLYTRKF